MFELLKYTEQLKGALFTAAQFYSILYSFPQSCCLKNIFHNIYKEVKTKKKHSIQWVFWAKMSKYFLFYFLSIYKGVKKQDLSQ